MNSTYYKYCIVPQCQSTSIKTPTKLFIYVPNNEQMRKKWLKLARRDDAHSLSTNSRMYFCEDHFDLRNDMVNYTEYHIMGKVSQVRMKPGCTPSKFECQEDRRKRTCSSTERPYIKKKQRMMTIAECLKSCTPSSSRKDVSETSSDFQTIGENVQESVCEQKMNKSIQVVLTPKFRSKAVQTNMKSKNQATLKPSVITSSTSPFKSRTIMKSTPSVSGLSRITRNIMIEEEHSDSDTSLYIPSTDTNSRSPSVHSLQVKSSSD